jgi:hypothetical protein
MHPLRRLAVVGLAVSCLCLASCVFSEHPLSDPDTAKADEDLIGLWAKEGDGETDVLAIGRATGVDGLPKGVMSTADVRIDKDGLLSASEPRPAFFVSVVGKENFMNFFTDTEAIAVVMKDGTPHRQWNAGGIKGYLLMRYEVAKDTLIMWAGHMEAAGVVGVIEGGKLTGEVKRENGSLRSAKLTDSTENLVKFLKGGGSKELFPDPDAGADTPHAHKLVYRRLKAAGK